MDVNGIAQAKTKITIFYPYAVPDSKGLVQLYDGTTQVNSPFDAVTDDKGVYNLRIDYKSGGGLQYSELLQVSSGSVIGGTFFGVDITGSTETARVLTQF